MKKAIGFSINTVSGKHGKSFRAKLHLNQWFILLSGQKLSVYKIAIGYGKNTFLTIPVN